MARIDLQAAMLALALLAAPPAGAAGVVLTGEVQAVDAQLLYVPAANSSPLVLRYFVPEGTRVEEGDVVLRIDPGASAGQIRELDAQIEQARARMAKELAELRVKAIDAELAVVDAKAALESAKVDAAIPADLISGLDYDRYQGELSSSKREYALKQKELAIANAAVQRRKRDGALEVEKLVAQRDYHAARVASAVVRAEQDGVVIHGFSNGWLGDGRIDEGSSVFPGSVAGKVVSGGTMQVQAWALAPDRRGLRVGQAVRLAFDALPGRHAAGRITAIAGAPESRPEWGEGRYYTISIELPEQDKFELLPGMSVRVDARTATGDGGAEDRAVEDGKPGDSMRNGATP